MTTLLFCGSIDGWKRVDFFRKCNGKQHTLTLFKILNGPCIGGYTKSKWIERPKLNERNGADPDAFLFNLTQRRHFPVKNPAFAIKNSEMWGPYFGNGELGADNDDFNEELACVSLTGESVYDIPENSNGINQLTS